MMSEREQLRHEVENKLLDIVYDYARHFGAEDWRDMFDAVFAGAYGDGADSDLPDDEEL
jgi:hypothetical protein